MTLVSLSRTGRYIALRTLDGLEVVDALGPAPRVRIAGAIADFACTGTLLWALADGGRRIDRFALASGRAVRPAIELPHAGAALIADRGDAVCAAIVAGAPGMLALETGAIAIDHAADRVYPIAGRRIAAVTGTTLQLVELGRRAPVLATVQLPGLRAIASVHAMYGGRLLAIVGRTDDHDVWTVVRADGTRVHPIAVPASTRWAIAGDAGTAIAVSTGHWRLLDLRRGAVRAEGEPPFALDDVDIASDGQHVVFAGGSADAPRVVHVSVQELLACANRSQGSNAERLPSAAATANAPAFAHDAARHEDRSDPAHVSRKDAGADASSHEDLSVPAGVGGDARPQADRSTPAAHASRDSSRAASNPHEDLASHDETAGDSSPHVDRSAPTAHASRDNRRAASHPHEEPASRDETAGDASPHARSVLAPPPHGSKSRPHEDHRSEPCPDRTSASATDSIPLEARSLAGEARHHGARPHDVVSTLAQLVPRALGEPLRPLVAAANPAWPPYASAREHLDDLVDLVAARIEHALAVAELARATSGTAATGPASSSTAARLADTIARTAGRTRSAIAAGVALPVLELMRELDLSPLAGHILMLALAPIERGEIAQLVQRLAGDPRRPLVDRWLVETILAGDDRARRAAVSAELAAGSPLRRSGAVHVAGESALDSITVDPIVLARLRQHLPARTAVRPLAELWLAADTAQALAEAVARPGREPLRLVLRGRRGSGRRSIAAALAARIGRAIADIDCARLPRAGAAMATALQHELAGAVLGGGIPVIAGLELADAADAEGSDRLRQVLRAHPGPLVIRAALESTLPLDPGHRTVVLPALSEAERAGFWRAALARSGVAAAGVDTLAARWRLGPGQIEDVVAMAKTRPGTALDDLARQHVATRLAHVATPVRRLADWEHVALADDVLDSVREFIGRVAQRRTVFDDWGFDAKVASSRGLTALFYGPPGTGKTMVAGLIARELGLELYRVDLSRIMSKWIGETEKNLAEVFDAAEDGQVVILFDEADSLFAKRTEVKTSVDRYANLEVNYLLQRLDSFEGIAILTTNLDGAIDPAFKRRMSLRLQFPFPDEDMRKRLWAAHIPAATPTANDFNFDELARRFPLSGGYIRNSALRAAFLAAHERRPLAHEHLLRAIALEYRELGQLAIGGRLE